MTSDGDNGSIETTKRPFKSYRLRSAYEKPWLKERDLHKTRRNDWIIYGFLGLGFALAALVIVWMVLPYRPGEVSPQLDVTNSLFTLMHS